MWFYMNYHNCHPIKFRRMTDSELELPNEIDDQIFVLRKRVQKIQNLIPISSDLQRCHYYTSVQVLLASFTNRFT